MGAEDGMWTEAHRARHEPGLKELVAACAVEEIAAWLGRADPPRSGRATPVRRVVGAIAWHLRVGGPWRALPAGWPPWRTVYGWFRRWLELGLFDALLREVARRRRRKGGRRPGPTLAIVDTQAVKCIAVRGPRGGACPPASRRLDRGDAGKKVLGRKRVALVDAEGHWLAGALVPAPVPDRGPPGGPGARSPSCRPRCRTGTRWRRWTPARRAGPPCGRASTTPRSRPSAAANGRTSTGCATASYPATRRPRASSCSPAAGWWSGASAGCPTGAASPGTAPAGSMPRPPASPSSASSPASRRCSTRCRSAPPHGRPTQTGSEGTITHRLA